MKTQTKIILIIFLFFLVFSLSEVCFIKPVFAKVLQGGGGGTGDSFLRVAPKTAYPDTPINIEAQDVYITMGQAGAKPWVEFGDGKTEICPTNCEKVYDSTGRYVWDRCTAYCSLSHKYSEPKEYTVKLMGTTFGIASAIYSTTVHILKPIKPTGSTALNPLKATSISDILKTIGKGILTLGFAGALLMIIIGGYYFIFSGGNPQKASKGKKIILISLIGLAILIIAWGIVWFVVKIFK